MQTTWVDWLQNQTGQYTQALVQDFGVELIHSGVREDLGLTGRVYFLNNQHDQCERRVNSRSI